MPTEATWIVIAGLSAIGCLVLIRMQMVHRIRLKAARSTLFEPVYDLFDDYRVTQEGLLYPELAGHYRGHAFKLDTVIDTLTFRKLPVLWLRVTLLVPIPGIATLDILVRSQNVEFYSPSNDLPHQIRTPMGWPADAMVRTDDPARVPDLAIVNRHVRMFDRPETKELLVTAKGVRIVHLLDQAQRAEYLVLRQADFANVRMTMDVLREIMDRAIALYEDLQADRKAA